MLLPPSQKLIAPANADILSATKKSMANYAKLYPVNESLAAQVNKSLSAQKDSALSAKFSKQLKAYYLFGNDAMAQPDTALTKAVNENFGQMDTGTLSAKSADKLTAKKTQNVSTIIFWLICLTLSLFAVIKKWSLIPLLGLTTCLYLLTGMTKANWLWFGGWLAIGLVIYFLYGYKKSKLAS